MVTRVADDIEWSCMIIMDGGEMEYMQYVYSGPRSMWVAVVGYGSVIVLWRLTVVVLHNTVVIWGTGMVVVTMAGTARCGQGVLW